MGASSRGLHIIPIFVQGFKDSLSSLTDTLEELTPGLRSNSHRASFMCSHSKLMLFVDFFQLSIQSIVEAALHVEIFRMCWFIREEGLLLFFKSL